MEASPAKHRVAFGLIVFALVALGAYLVRPAANPGRHQPAAAVTPAQPSGHGASQGSSQSGAAPAGSARADIYQWLPFTPAGLAAAASVAVRFGDAYGTFSYTQDAAAYIRPLHTLSSPVLAQQIKAAYALPGVATARISGKQVSVGTATIASIRAFGPNSLTFVVQVTQLLTELAGRKLVTTLYAVTLTGSGASWLVTDIELASAGNS